MLRRTIHPTTTSPFAFGLFQTTTKRYQSNNNNSLTKDELSKAWMQLQYQVQGYKVADYDPLKRPPPPVSQLKPEFYGLREDDPAVMEMINRGKQLFCGAASFECSHLNTDGQTEWISTQVMNKKSLPVETQKQYLKHLLEADCLEEFFNKRFGAAKRFGLEGGESLIPGLWSLVEAAADCDVNRVVIGMAHRGRLQVLHHLCGKPLWKIFREFKDVITPGTQLSNKGDVKYHLGHKKVHKMSNGKEITVECLPNPSHLEAVNPVVTGFARGCAELDSGYKNVSSAIPVLLHGDAAVIGQGVCFETTIFEEVKDYTVGGTIHVVINNQVGFTTDPQDSRSVKHSTALAYLNNSPVIRVNGDSPVRVAEAFKLAVRHREQFHEDVFIDLVCYRRRGHNEGDSPDFTQPTMYETIKNHPTTAKIYSDALIKENIVTAEEVEEMREDILERYKNDYNKANNENEVTKPTLLHPRGFPAHPYPITGVNKDKLKEIGLSLVDTNNFPPGFKPNAKVVNGSDFKVRRTSIENESHMVWATCEQLALGSLIKEGIHVRYSGEDIQRGTFTQRQFVLHDVETPGKKFCSLQWLSAQDPQKNGKITLANSPLSEYAVAGYEFGYSVARPDSLVLWEAQFGDFANGAQIIWDQFLSSSTTKWAQRCGLIISLPHGYDGQGPEHSSGRIERFLQSCNEPVYLPEAAHHDHSDIDPYNALEGRNIGSNWAICYPSTPANYFHMLRRQMHRKPEHRVPLVFFFSKGTLRQVGSLLSEMGEGTRFEPVLVDKCFVAPPKWIEDKDAVTTPAASDVELADPAKLKIVLICTGQVSRALLTRRKQLNMTESVAVIRLEQLAPFPYELLRNALRNIGATEDTRVVWVQEEPKNAGAWTHVRPRIRTLFKSMYGAQNNVDVDYAGRGPAASPSTGYSHVHGKEMEDLLNVAFGSDVKKISNKNAHQLKNSAS